MKKLVLFALLLPAIAFAQPYWNSPTGLPSQSGHSGEFLTTNGSVASWSAAAGNSALSSITAASGANTISSGDNAQVWRWALTTAAKSAFTFTESAASTSGVNNQILVNINTLANSTATPLRVIAQSNAIPNLQVSRLGSIIISANDAATGGLGIDVSSGSATAGNAAGGDINITTGAGFGNGDGGQFAFQAGNGGPGGNGGNFKLQGGSGIVGGEVRLIGNINTNAVNTTIPLVGSCGTAPPDVAGSSAAMFVTIGTGGVATSCAIDFSYPFTTPPVCTANSDTDIAALKVVTTTTTVTVSKTTPFTASSHLHVICLGIDAI